MNISMQKNSKSYVELPITNMEVLLFFIYIYSFIFIIN